jgi:hypothetical protein
LMISARALTTFSSLVYAIVSCESRRKWWRTNFNILLLREVVGDLTLLEELGQRLAVFTLVDPEDLLVPHGGVNTAQLAGADLVEVVLVFQRVDALVHLVFRQIKFLGDDILAKFLAKEPLSPTQLRGVGLVAFDDKLDKSTTVNP